MPSFLSVCGFNIVTTDDELGRDRELLRCEAEGLLSDSERYSLALDEHHAGFYSGDEASGITLTLTLTGIGGFTGYRLVGEDADPDLALALHIARYRDTCCLDLTCGNPEGTERLDAERAESEFGATVRDAVILAPTVLRPSIFDSLRL